MVSSSQYVATACITLIIIPSCLCNLILSETKMLFINQSFNRMANVTESFLPELILIDKLSRGGQPTGQLRIRIEEILQNILLEDSVSISETCAVDILYYAESIRKNDNSNYSTGGLQWYRQMIDSFGTESMYPPTNAQENIWTGDFRQCVLLDVHKNCTKDCQDKKPDFEGKYCLANVALPVPFEDQFMIGTCIPSTCKGTEINEILAHIKKTYNTNITLSDETCQTKTDSGYEWDTTSIAILILYVILFTAVTVATIICAIPSRTDQKLNKEHGTGSGILSAFSACQNTKNVFNTKCSQENTFRCVNGIRAISMFWIILAHNIEQLYNMSLWKNPAYTIYASEIFALQMYVNSEFAVDTFIFITGFLLLYTTVKHLTASKGKFNIFLFYFHRVVRLTPAYAMVLAFFCGIYQHLGSGPFWALKDDSNYASCRKVWWRNLLYVNIYFSDKEACMTQSWYLCIDTFFYIMSPLLFIPLYRKPKLGLVMWSLCFLVSLLVPAYIIYYYNFPSLVTFPQGIRNEQGYGFFYMVYTKPWTRMHVFLIGMLVGFFCFHKRNNLQLNKVFVSFMWLLAGSAMFLVIYGTYPYTIHKKTMLREMSTFYGTFSRPLWAMAIGWIVIACSSGYGGVVDTILSWKALMPMSKLSYCCYLVHYLVLQHLTETRKGNQIIDMNFVNYRIITVFVFSSFFAYLLNILVEAPAKELEKILIRKYTKSVIQPSKRKNISLA